MLFPAQTTSSERIWGDQIEETLKVMEESKRWDVKGSRFLAGSAVLGWVVMESIIHSSNKYVLSASHELDVSLDTG